MGTFFESTIHSPGNEKVPNLRCWQLLMFPAIWKWASQLRRRERRAHLELLDMAVSLQLDGLPYSAYFVLMTSDREPCGQP